MTVWLDWYRIMVSAPHRAPTSALVYCHLKAPTSVTFCQWPTNGIITVASPLRNCSIPFQTLKVEVTEFRAARQIWQAIGDYSHAFHTVGVQFHTKCHSMRIAMGVFCCFHTCTLLAIISRMISAAFVFVATHSNCNKCIPLMVTINERWTRTLG